MESVRRIHVYDRRSEHRVPKKVVEIRGDFNGFLLLVNQKFNIAPHETFVVATTDRTVLDYDKFEALQDGSTVHLLQSESQSLASPTEESVKFVPHYDTLIRCGMYEYYASQGQKSLPYALAELIDNSISATAKNPGARTIEIRMMFDETVGRPAVVVLDNGSGMTSKQLSNWAVYRLSKFSRSNSTCGRDEDGYVHPDPVPRSLNSDISYFGVGGKQAVFYIGESTRMISKSEGSPDVHEFVLSKEDFERKEKNKEDVYSGTILNRKPGDSSHVVRPEEFFLHSLISEEFGKSSFTAVVITGVLPQHIHFLKKDFDVWTRQLSHIYHYYIHGVNGKNLSAVSTESDSVPKIDIQITLREKPPRCPRALNLKEVDNDMQTLYINSAVDTFEFTATTTEKDGGSVEGVIRYHPFLYDRETFPTDPDSLQASPDDDEDEDFFDSEGAVHQGRGMRPIFDCFWNGRLIPYTKVAEFDWCSPGKDKDLAECFRRISGVLFTDDGFKVSTNKLTFMDLELKLKHRDTIYTRVLNSQKLRASIQKEFTLWLKSCHEKWDKQVKFSGFRSVVSRTDVQAKKMQYPWSTFSSIEFDGKVYRAGQLVKSQKTLPILYGSVVRFLLYGKYDGSVFATGGEVEVCLEPKALHDKNKTIPISKIDKTATNGVIKKNIDSDSAKLPETLKVSWPDCNPWTQNSAHPAGTVFGPLKVEIMNRKGASISVMPAVGHTGKRFIVELKVVQHGPEGDQEVKSCVAQASTTWGYWFTKIDTLTQLGSYTLTLKTMINDTNATAFGGRDLPSYKLHFTITVGGAQSFAIGEVSAAVQVGVAFDIPLIIKDGYEHPAAPPEDLTPALTCSDLELSYESVDVSETTLTIRGVKAKGKVLSYRQSKTYEITVTLPGLKNDTQTMKICLLPGSPRSLFVLPEDDVITVENGNSVTFNVEIHDEAGNITAHPKQIVVCKVQGVLPTSTDCSTSGVGQLVTKPINLKITQGKAQKLTAKFFAQGQKVAPVTRELEVVPSTRICRMELCSKDDLNLVLRDKERIEWLAGGLLEISYKLYDEAGREVPLSAEIAARIKVSWTENMNVEELAEGKLPDIQVPKLVLEPRLYQVTYQVTYQDQNVNFSFCIMPHPDVATRLKATLQKNTVKLGEFLSGNINLELVDQFDNVTNSLNSSCKNLITLEAEGLDTSNLHFDCQDESSSVQVSGLRFQSGSPGPREVTFRYRKFTERIIIKLTAGEPAKLQLISGPAAPLQVLNNRGIPTPFVVQLCDQWGNPSADQRVVVELKSSSPKLKVKTAVASQPVNAQGKASFTVSSVSGLKGNYQLDFKSSLNQKPIPGPSVTLTVIPDPTKPVSLEVRFNTDAVLRAGGVFPDFSVTVVSEEGSPITKLNPAAVSMLLWSGASSGQRPPPTATELKCNKPMRNEQNDSFHFRDKEIPELSGQHTIQFSLRIDKNNTLFSAQICVSVEPNVPVRLGPDLQPPTPAVSYSGAVSSRILVDNLTLRVMDSFGNPAGRDLNGDLVVSIRDSGGGNSTLPLFEGRSNSLKMNLTEGETHITRLLIMKNSPGVNGGSYILVFTPQINIDVALAPFELPFHFYNDEENQRKMSSLSKERDKITTLISAHHDIFTTYSELINLLTSNQQEASKKESHIRSELTSRNVAVGKTVQDIDRLIREKQNELNRILNKPRRVCSIRDPFSLQHDVLGMVGHLALVEDDDAARVISWHVSGDMDCVITSTTAAARRIFNDTAGRQQVMALDSVYVPNTNRPLPHIKNGRKLFEPTGNPKFARDLLLFPQQPERCIVVFKNILGDTILIDDLGSANNYRRAVVQQKMPCPTILTRQGDRISAKGKFGGAQNKAPPMGALPLFGAPLPPQSHTLQEHIELLQQHQAALTKRDDLAKELHEVFQKLNSPEMQEKQREMEVKKKELEAIERRLGSTPVRPPKRSLQTAGEPSRITHKRAKSSST